VKARKSMRQPLCSEKAARTLGIDLHHQIEIIGAVSFFTDVDTLKAHGAEGE
jgi:hypothetical protein